MSGTIFQAATEVNFGERDGRITATFLRTGDLSSPVNVTYDVTSESAAQGADFIGSSGVVRFEAGQDRVTVPFDLVNDALNEATETFIVSLVSLDSGTLGVPRTLRINILDDENPVLPPVNPPLISDYQVVVEPVIRNLDQPLNFEFSPINPNIVYVAEKGGLIRTFNTQTGADLGAFIDLRGQVNEFNDRGLLDIALHPDFANNPYLYAFYVVDPPGVGADYPGNRFAHVVRFTADADEGYLRVVPGSGVVIAGATGQTRADINGSGNQDFSDPAFASLPSSERYLNPNASQPPLVVGGIKQDYIKVDSMTHAGGSLAFGPDGKLYISIGDGASPNYADPRAPDVQNLNSLSGKILRVDPLTGDGLTDNPFYQPGQNLDSNISKVFQYGLRNPFSIAFDPVGRLFITDTGWNAYEEINSAGPGANFGWPWFEGREGGVLSQTSGYNALPNAAAFYAGVNNGSILVVPPYASFGHAGAVPGFQNQAITGGSLVYSGNRYPTEFQGDYFFTNFPFGHVFTIDSNNRQDVKYLYTSSSAFAPVHFVQGPDGYVYYADLGEREEAGATTGGIGRLQIFSADGPRVSVAGTPASVTEGTSPSATITFSLNEIQASDVLVTYSTLNGSAVAGSDFTGVSDATIIIPAGQTSVSTTIAILNDTAFESLETFSVALASARLNGAAIAVGAPATVSILDNEPIPTGTNLLVNGSLEASSVGVNGYGAFQTIPGWTALTGGTIELWNAHNGVVASSGTNFAELDFDYGYDGFTQSVQTVAGQAYALTFDLRARPNVASTTQGVEIVWNDVVVATTTPGTAWAPFTVALTGTGQDRLTIREVASEGTDGFGALLDNFRLVSSGGPPVPVVPQVSVAAVPASVTEGTNPSATLTFSLNTAQARDVIVTYSTVNGTAVAGSDFTAATNATITIPAGQTSISTTLAILNDTIFEPSESFTVALGGATLNGAAIATGGPATVTILDNDPAPVVPQVSVAAVPATVTEGTSASTTVTFSLNTAQANDVIVTYSTVNGTAVAGSDFTAATSATITIPAGQTSVSTTLAILNDTSFEASESFTVALASATLNGAPITIGGPAPVTILDNDSLPTGTNLLVNGSLEMASVGANNYGAFQAIPGWTAIAGGGSIELWNAHNGVVATDGTTFAELDYNWLRDGFGQSVQTVAGQAYNLSFDLRSRPGVSTTTQGVEIVWNDVVVATTTPGAAWAVFNVALTGTGGQDRLAIREVASQGGDGFGALLDNFKLVTSGGPPVPPAPQVSVAAVPASVTEGTSPNTTLTFSLNSAQASDVVVTYSTVNGTAIAGSDFAGATSATITIPAGQTSVSTTIAILNDTTFEPSESFSVALGGATLNGAAIATGGPATVTILDNDPAPVVPQVSVAAAPATVTEGTSPSATITFSLNTAQANDVIVTYSTVNGTAIAGSDFTGATSATITIPAGQTSVSTALAILNDTSFEASESFTVALASATLNGAPITVGGPATVAILDNDSLPTGTNLLVNGSLEMASVGANNYGAFQSIPGWTAIAGGGSIELWNAHNGVVATDGTTFAELDYNWLRDGFGQSVQTVGGQAYNLSFDLRSRPGVSTTTQGVEIVWNDVVVATTTPGAAWAVFNVALTGTGGQDRLAIREVASQGGDSFGALLDNFRLVSSGGPPVPVVPQVSVAAVPASVTEGTNPSATLTFSLNSAQASDVIVTYSTVNGTAVAGSDFTGATSATVTIPAGQTSVSTTLAILNDTIFEPSESFSVALGGATLNGAAIATGGPDTVTILDNDPAPVVPQVSAAAAPATVTEGTNPSTTLTFTLNTAQAGDVVVTYSTVNGTAVAGSDFTGATGATITIPAGQTSISTTLAILNDTTFEPSESFTVTLGGATLNGTPIAIGGTAAVTILDNDPLPTGTNLLVNGSLEMASVGANNYGAFQSIPGWTAIAGGGSIELWNAHNGVVATDGTTFAELDYNWLRDGFGQSVQTVAGQAYNLSFDLRSRPGVSTTTQGVEIVWNDVVVATTTPGAAWAVFNVALTGTGGQDRLAIREIASQGGDGFGALLDNFKLVAPAPPSVQSFSALTVSDVFEFAPADPADSMIVASRFGEDLPQTAEVNFDSGFIPDTIANEPDAKIAADPTALDPTWPADSSDEADPNAIWRPDGTSQLRPEDFWIQPTF
ncbi:Calx-beta domain-containing protein [Bosea sp. PAMC 26642]|uniref:Calx-beta domain-containing protein n=1 Tax=Bosea sp. (strain PAMC 26642) TaxID=1792307 RepID=UPI00077041E0|nr:Calx-beta domain-containing protein [Bosea sp. PAMC 26642]AMJ62438.1 hypothetical protein AXW83_20955 [Bosea sp. PAMC 26642]